jgi:hypothetical protein
MTLIVSRKVCRRVRVAGQNRSRASMTPRIPRRASRVHVPRLTPSCARPSSRLALVLWSLVPVALRTSSLTTLAGVVALLWAMIAYETATYDERRYRLRHGLEADPPSR